MTLRVWNGTEWLDETAPRTSVERMMATHGVTWAHRGGSQNWAECSEYAYDQSVLAGYQVLEFSAHRTSDGWWVGTHDPMLDRTSGVTGVGPIRNMTRAQVESYQITNGASGGPQPYYGMEDFILKYGRDNVLVIDPKAVVVDQWNLMPSFFDILDNLAGPHNTVIKFHGSHTAFAGLIRDRGYVSWGYFFPEDWDDGFIQNRWQNWDMLGMSYGASTTIWDFMVGTGLPVVAHILPSQAAYDIGLAKGAVMGQCANVAGITPVGWR